MQPIPAPPSEPLTLVSLPLFPLGTVLFPDGLLPLRIFEVRYLDMIGKCHALGAPFGVVCLREGSEVQRPAGDAYASEVLYPVGTLATITALSRPQAGLIEIRCVGSQRFTVTRSEKLRHGLWIADVVQLAPDLPTAVPADLQPVADALDQLIRNLRGRDVAEQQMPMGAPYRLDDCGWVANRWCELLALPAELKQRLMALDNPLVRLELVADILDRHGIGKAD